jgi:hypothetical protein
MKAGTLLVPTIAFTTLLSPGSLIYAQGNFWEQTSGPKGADVFAFAMDSTGRLLAASNAGIYGQDLLVPEWFLLGLGEHSVYSILIHSSGTILAGTSGGLFKSIDQGLTWVISDLLAVVSDIVMSPSGNLFALDPTDGIYRSTDTGEHWTEVAQGSYWDIAIGPTGDLYAVDFIDLVRSIDDGSTWEVVSLGTVYGNPVAVAITSDNEIYLGTVDPQCPNPGPHPCAPYSGLFRSTDGIGGWNVIYPQAEIIEIFVVPLGDVSLLHEQTNGLSRYRPVDSSSTSMGLIGVNSVVQSNDGSLFAGGDGWGVAVSSDDGVSWLEANEGLVGRKIPVMTSLDSGFLLAGAAPNVWRTMDRGDSWVDVLYFYEWQPLFLEADGSTIFASISGIGLYESNDYGTSWTARFFSAASGCDYWSRNVYSFLVMEGGRLFAGAHLWDGYGCTDDGLFLSTNGGDSWEKIGLDGISVRSLDVDSNGIIFAGTAGDGIYRSTDDGATWSFSGITGASVTSILATTADVVLAGTDGDGMYESRDGGVEWSSVANGLSTNRISAMEMNGEGELFAGSFDQGVFVSTDGGESWSQTVSGMSNTSVQSLAVDEEGYIFAGTDGSGVFRSTSPTTSVSRDGSGIPTGIFLSQNYPNPFNAISNFEFSISDLSDVTLRVYDLLGREVATLVDERLIPGTYTRQWDAAGMASGVYVCRMTAGEFVQTRKLVLIR